jgi:predicted RNA binding protein YcfA (HicA-like mRNA interferase family)
MKAKELIKLLKQNGWELKRVNGSHHIFKKNGFEYNISVPVHGNGDIPKGTANSIMKDAGLK